MRNVRIGHVISIVLLVGTVIGILQPAYSADIGLTQIFLSLFHPGWNQEFLMRWLLVLGFLAAVYMIVLQLIYRNTPITVVFTRLTVEFGANGSAVFFREQFLRANQPNVTAYISSHGPSTATGRVLADKLAASAYCFGWDAKDKIEVRPTGSAIEVLHIFSKPLPFSWYMPLIPTWILHRDPERLFKFVRKNIVQRTDEVHYENEFNVARPVMNFHKVGRYQHLNLAIELRFGNFTPPDFSVREIRSSGVIDLQFEQKQNNVRLVRIERMTAGTIRISWTVPHPAATP